MINKILVPLETVKANSFIETNAEPSKLRQAAIEAQRVEVRSILGATLTDLFLSSVQDDGTLSGLTSIQTTFYTDYLVPMFATYTQAQYIYATHYQISNVGVVTTTGKNNTSATDEAVSALFKRTMNSADYYAQRAKNFILMTENHEDLGVHYFASNQNITPQAKVQQGFIFTPYRNGGSC